MKKRNLLLSLILTSSLVVSNTSLAGESSESTPESSSTGQGSSTRTASDIQTVITQEIKKEEAKKRATGVGMGFTYNAKIILDTEKGDATVKRDYDTKNYDADVNAGIFSFSKDLGEDLTVGVILPYRKIKVDDSIKSQLTMISVAPFVSLRTMKKGNFYNDLSFYGFLSLNKLKTKLDSDNQRDKIDYKELGFGASINPTYKFSDMFTLDFNFGYQYSTYLVRKSDIDLTGTPIPGFDWKEYLKDLFKPRHLVNMGTSLTIKPIQNAKIILGYAYSANVLGNQRLKEEKANYYYIKAYYTLWLFRISLGYKKTDDANNYEEDTYMASIGLNF